MKQCPTCQSQYTDDTLQFCLQDGSPLQPASGSQEKTLDYGEQETVIAGRQSSQINTPNATNPTGWNPNQYQSDAAAAASPEKKSNATLAVFITAFVMLLLFSLVGIGAWYYYRGAANDPNANILIAKKTPNSELANRTTTANANTSKTRSATPPLTSSSNANTTNTATVDREQIKRDVSQRVISWKSAAESLNLDSYMSHYAPTVDYYNKKGASVGFVRADKQKAFTAYNSIQITLGDITVSPDASGETATAVFDKEWVFQGARYSAGKVQTQLKLRKVNGQWLIAGERDLKVYYTQ